MTEGRHVDAELVRASGPGRETQERQLAVIGEHLILRAGGETVGRDAALDERALGAGDGSVDDAARRRDAAEGEGAVFAPQLLRMQRTAQQLVNVAGLRRDEQARGALVQAADEVRHRALAEVGDQRSGKVRRGEVGGHRVHGESGGLVEHQQVLILVDDGKGNVERRDVRFARRALGENDGHGIAGADDGVHMDACAVEQDRALTPLERFEQRGGDAKLAAQQVLERTAVEGGGDGALQGAHGGRLLS